MIPGYQKPPEERAEQAKPAQELGWFRVKMAQGALMVLPATPATCWLGRTNRHK